MLVIPGTLSRSGGSQRKGEGVSLSAPDKADELKGIAVFQDDIFPTGAFDDFSVQLGNDPPVVPAKLEDDLVEGFGPVQFLFRPVDRDVHGHHLRPNRPKNQIFLLRAGPDEQATFFLTVGQSGGIISCFERDHLPPLPKSDLR